MKEELNIAGVFVPTFVVACICGLAASIVLSRVLSRCVGPDYKRFVWHAPLFDFLVFVILVGVSYDLLGTLLS